MTASYRDKYLYIINIGVFIVACMIGCQSDILIGFGLIFLIMISAGLILTIFNKPQYGIILTICGAMLGPLGNLFTDEQIIPFSLFQVFLLFTIYLYAIHLLRRGNLELQFDTPFKIVSLFISMLVLTTIYSYDRGEALLLISALVVLATFAYMVSDLFNKIHMFNRLFFAILALNIYHSIQAVYQYVVNPQAAYFNALSAESYVFMRQVGSWTDPNKFGLMLILPILFLVCEMFVKKKSFWNFRIRDIFFLPIIALFFTAMITTYSRSSWLSLTIGVICLFILAGKIRRLFFIGILFGTVLSIIALSNELFFQAVVKRITSITDITTSVSNISRIVLAKGCYEMFKDSYFMGFGFGSSPALAPSYIDLTKTLGVTRSHNLFMTMLAEIGIIGLSLFLVMVFSFIRQGWRLIASKNIDEESKYYVIILISYTFSLLTFYQFYPTGLHENMLWFCFGAIMAIKNIHSGRRKYRTAS